MGSMMQKRLRSLAVLSAIAAAAGSSAQAHALLLSSQPAAGESVAGPDVDFTLRYNSRVDAARSRLTLKDDGGKTRRLDAGAGDGPNLLRGHADGLGAGKFTLHWEVLSVDGHISGGDLPFVVAPR